MLEILATNGEVICVDGVIINAVVESIGHCDYLDPHIVYFTALLQFIYDELSQSNNSEDLIRAEWIGVNLKEMLVRINNLDNEGFFNENPIVFETIEEVRVGLITFYRDFPSKQNSIEDNFGLADRVNSNSKESETTDKANEYKHSIHNLTKYIHIGIKKFDEEKRYQFTVNTENNKVFDECFPGFRKRNSQPVVYDQSNGSIDNEQKKKFMLKVYEDFKATIAENYPDYLL